MRYTCTPFFNRPVSCESKRHAHAHMLRPSSHRASLPLWHRPGMHVPSAPLCVTGTVRCVGDDSMERERSWWGDLNLAGSRRVAALQVAFVHQVGRQVRACCRRPRRPPSSCLAAAASVDSPKSMVPVVREGGCVCTWARACVCKHARGRLVAQASPMPFVLVPPRCPEQSAMRRSHLTKRVRASPKQMLGMNRSVMPKCDVRMALCSHGLHATACARAHARAPVFSWWPAASS